MDPLIIDDEEVPPDLKPLSGTLHRPLRRCQIFDKGINAALMQVGVTRGRVVACTRRTVLGTTTRPFFFYGEHADSRLTIQISLRQCARSKLEGGRMPIRAGGGPIDGFCATAWRSYNGGGEPEGAQSSDSRNLPWSDRGGSDFARDSGPGPGVPSIPI